MVIYFQRKKPPAAPAQVIQALCRPKCRRLPVGWFLFSFYEVGAFKDHVLGYAWGNVCELAAPVEGGDDDIGAVGACIGGIATFRFGVKKKSPCRDWRGAFYLSFACHVLHVGGYYAYCPRA